MNYNNITEKLQEALMEASQFAQSMQHGAIDSLHLLKAILTQAESDALFQELNKDKFKLLEQINRQLDSLAQVQGGQLTMSQNLQKDFEKAAKWAEAKGDQFISTFAFLAVMLDEKTYGINKKELEEAIMKIRNGQTMNSATAENQLNALEKYGRDLVKDVRDGKVDPVIGRDEEIRRVIQILSRKQ
ncbi:MAG TPA: Clp protease N-terminal domain-containing protein, partial [Erysipelothrix sp.]